MKTKTQALALLFSLAAASVPLMAQTATNAATPPPGCPASGKPWHGKNNSWCGEENKALREKFKAAFKKIKNDPELVAAQKSFESARTSLEQIRTKLLLKADPFLADAIKKHEAFRAEWQKHRGEWKKNAEANGNGQAAPASTPANP